MCTENRALETNRFIILLNFQSTATLPKQAEYEAYIDMELKDGDPARIQCIYERAIKDNCLDANLWKQYTEYLVSY